MSQVLTDEEVREIVIGKYPGHDYASSQSWLTAMARKVEEAVQLKMRLLQYHCPDCHKMMVPSTAEQE